MDHSVTGDVSTINVADIIAKAWERMLTVKQETAKRNMELMENLFTRLPNKIIPPQNKSQSNSSVTY